MYMGFKTRVFFFYRVTSVVDAFENLLGDNVNGAVMAITPRGKQYRYPHELKAAKL